MAALRSHDLGDGYTLDEYPGGIFKFVHSGEIVGSLAMSRSPESQDSDFPGRLASVQDVLIYPGPHRGKGLFRRALSVLKPLYGGLRSSHSGNTSDSAAKAWQRSGARSVLTTDDPKRYGGSWYSLESRARRFVERLVDSPFGSVHVNDNGYIKNLFVNYGQRGRGHGTALMIRITDEADDNGQTLSLHIGQDRPELVGWYKRFGFEIAGKDQFGILMQRRPQSGS